MTTDSQPDNEPGMPVGLGCNEGLGPLPEHDDLEWHALNYRTAAPQHAELMWQELLACVNRRVAAEREQCAATLDREARGWLGELRPSDLGMLAALLRSGA